MLEISYHVGQDAADQWDLVKGFVAQVLPKMQGEMALSDFFDGFVGERFHLFVGRTDGEVTGCMVTELIAYPQYSVIRVLVAAGAGFAKFVAQYMGYIKNWANVNGASFIEALIIPEMMRYYRRFGSQKVYEVIRISTGA